MEVVLSTSQIVKYVCQHRLKVGDTLLQMVGRISCWRLWVHAVLPCADLL